MTEPDDRVHIGQPATPLHYAGPPEQQRGKAAYQVLAILVSMIIIGLLVSVLLPPISHRYDGTRVKCASNMRQIGQAIAMYANTCGGRFPDDLGSLYQAQDLSPAVFTCPNSNETPVTPSSTTQATAAALLQPGHCSYIYLGKGLTDKTVTPDMVLLYEPLADHGGSGMNVMFGDFHVEWFSKQDGQAILNQVASGVRPVHDPTTAPTTGPAAGR